LTLFSELRKQKLMEYLAAKGKLKERYLKKFARVGENSMKDAKREQHRIERAES
jgi:hypothetical protein